MKKLVLAVLLVVLAAKLVSLNKRLKRIEELRVALQGVQLTQGMTLGYFRTTFGEPEATEDGYQWGDFGLRVYTFKKEDGAEPYIVSAVAGFPGKVKNAFIGGPCSKIFGAHEKGELYTNHRELGWAGPNRVWVLIFNETQDHVVTQLMLARMVKKETTQYGDYCPRGFANYYYTASLVYDADGSPP